MVEQSYGHVYGATMQDVNAAFLKNANGMKGADGKKDLYK